MDFALETGTAASASHKIDLFNKYGSSYFGVYEKRKFLGVIPYWHLLDYFFRRAAAEEWLRDNWKLPAYYHITRKVPA